MAIKVEVRRDGDVGVIEAAGYIDGDSGAQILAECNVLIADGIVRIAIDLGKITVINSMGIMSLLEVADKAKGAGGRACFCSLSATQAKTFRIMGVDTLADIVDTVEDAVAALR